MKHKSNKKRFPRKQINNEDIEVILNVYITLLYGQHGGWVMVDLKCVILSIHLFYFVFLVIVSILFSQCLRNFGPVIIGPYSRHFIVRACPSISSSIRPGPPFSLPDFAHFSSYGIENAVKCQSERRHHIVTSQIVNKLKTNQNNRQLLAISWQ